MKDYGLVSIITPSWNCAQFITEAIRSVQSQTYTDWELLFQDDCSTDNTAELVAQFAEKDSRIKYECNPKNSGAAITRNNALRRAKGKWIAFLDSDDLWASTKLEKQLKFMVDNNYAFSYHEYTEMTEDGNDMGVYVSGIKKVNAFNMYACCWPGCLSVMYDREKIKADLKELEQDIKSTGFYHNKAKNIISCCNKIISDFGGEIPDNMDDILSLAGVGKISL